MFKVNSYYKTDYFGVGTELSIQYRWIDDKHTQKVPVGIVWSLSLVSWTVDFGFWWGG